MNITLFHCNNCFNRNTVTIIGRWARLTIGLAITISIGAGALLVFFH